MAPDDSAEEWGNQRDDSGGRSRPKREFDLMRSSHFGSGDSSIDSGSPSCRKRWDFADLLIGSCAKRHLCLAGQTRSAPAFTLHPAVRRIGHLKFLSN